MGGESYAICLEVALHNRFQLLHGHRRITVGGQDLVAAAQSLRIVDQDIDNCGAFLSQHAHTLQKFATMRGIIDTDGIQIDLANLLADLQLIVAVLQEALAVVGQSNGAQPLADDVVVRHAGAGIRIRVSRGSAGKRKVQRCEGDLVQALRLRRGAGATGTTSSTSSTDPTGSDASRQRLRLVAAAGGTAAAAARGCLHSSGNRSELHRVLCSKKKFDKKIIYAKL